MADAGPECRQTLQQQRARFRQTQLACKPDMERRCKEVKPGEGRLIECLKQHRAELSAECGSLMR